MEGNCGLGVDGGGQEGEVGWAGVLVRDGCVRDDCYEPGQAS